MKPKKRGAPLKKSPATGKATLKGVSRSRPAKGAASLLDSDSSPFLMISRKTLVMSVVAVFLLGIGAILFFVSIDLELLFHADSLAIKIGGTVVSLDQFTELKRLAGKQAESQGEMEFAESLAESILLAEAGRDLKLDHQAAFQEKVAIFDRSVPPASDPQDLTRALFLIDELSRLTVKELENRFSNDKGNLGKRPASQPVMTTPDRLRVKTLLTPTEALASQAMAEAAAGRPFSELNASWSGSPYAAVGGDMGLVKPNDLPEGVFAKLSQVPIGNLTKGFVDEQGVHLFRVEERSESKAGDEERAALTQRRQTVLKKEYASLLQQQRSRMTYWIHPTLASTNDFSDKDQTHE